MRRLLRWRLDDADTIAAFVAAVALAALGQFSNVSPAVVLNGLFTVLALLAVALLRDRSGRITVQDAVREAILAGEQDRARHRETSERSETLHAEIRASVTDVSRTLADLRLSHQNVAKALADLRLVELANRDEITHELEEARRRTEAWLFRGATGGFFRRVTLPDCVSNAQAHRHWTPSHKLRVSVEILDPNNYDVCERYARARSRYSATSDLSAERWSSKRVQRELYATILVAALYMNRYDFLDLSLGLSATWRSHRTDIADSVAVVTYDDVTTSGQVIRSNSRLYALQRLDLQESILQARPVPIDLAKDTVLHPIPTVDDVRKLFDEISLRLVEFDNDDLRYEEVEDVMRKAGIHGSDSTR